MNGQRKIILFSFIVLFVFGFSMRSAIGAVKDSDADGLSDDAEINIYHTDPFIFDTDGDGVGDGQEVLDGTDPLDKNSSSIALLSIQDPGLLGSSQKFAWYLGRASGILAFTLLTGVVVFGLIMSSRAFIKFVPGTTIYETHKFISWLALATVILHFSSFFFDNFMKIKLVEALVPFSLSRSFSTAMGYDMGLSVALGIIAFYLMLILIFTSEFRSKMSPKTWRAIHYISAITYFLFIAHGFLTGTDSKEWWMRALYATSVSMVFFLILIRILSRNLIPSIRTWWRNKTEETNQPLGN